MGESARITYPDFEQRVKALRTNPDWWQSRGGDEALADMARDAGYMRDARKGVDAGRDWLTAVHEVAISFYATLHERLVPVVNQQLTLQRFIASEDQVLRSAPPPPLRDWNPELFEATYALVSKAMDAILRAFEDTQMPPEEDDVTD